MALSFTNDGPAFATPTTFTYSFNILHYPQQAGDAFSISLWYRLPNGGNDGLIPLFGSNSGTTNKNGCIFYLDTDGAGGTPWTLGSTIDGNTSINKPLLGSRCNDNNIIPDDRYWHHLLLACDKGVATEADCLAIYLDGVLVSHIPKPANCVEPGSSADAAHLLNFGADGDTDYPYTGAEVDMSHVAFWLDGKTLLGEKDAFDLYTWRRTPREMSPYPSLYITLDRPDYMRDEMRMWSYYPTITSARWTDGPEPLSRRNFFEQFVAEPAAAAGGRVMSSLASSGGLAGMGGIAGKGGGLAG